MLKVSVINRSNNPLPSYETEYSAGMDIRAYIDGPVWIKPMQRTLIPTGLFIELPEGFEAQIRPRSGLALKHGITILNSPGTIDADYRGELKVLLVNFSDVDFEVKHGDRIAQMILAKHELINWEEVEVLSETIRGEGGYGHTGV
ncbi:MAG TPA: dUTP diphosphatase [Sphingobacteriaceae bacterium]|nr:dUTP diphosphatase [Sphingobacteriaceae bacterium]